MRIKRISPDTTDPKQLYKEVYVAGNAEVSIDGSLPEDPYDGLVYKDKTTDKLWLYVDGGYVQINGDDSSGHIIQNGQGTSFPQRKNLRFEGSTVSDNAQDDATVIKSIIPTIEAGTTTTSEPGGNAEVTKNISSTDELVVFDFTIPRGEKGPQGETGPQGPQGSKGDSGVYYGTTPGDNDTVWIDPSERTLKPMDSVPIGGIMMLTDKSEIESDYVLECDGRSLSKTTYSDLFDKIGYTYGGSGDNFNIPDLRGKFVLGESGIYALGSTGGKSELTLVSDNLPSHSHVISLSTETSGSHNHSVSITTSENGSHTHSVNFYQSVGGTQYKGVVGPNQNKVGTDSRPILEAGDHQHTVNGDTGNNGDHVHSINGSTGSVGSGSSIDNLPPYITLIFVIKYRIKNLRSDMPVLKVKDEATGQWIGIDSIQGIDGKDGPQGEMGTPGVYLGTNEPTNPEYYVWVDPEGDNVYNLTSRTNYIINPDFKINQRNNTTVTTGYGPDRWKIGGSGSMTVSDNGLLLSTYALAVQYIEGLSSYGGYEFTLSGRTSDGVVHVNTSTLSTTITTYDGLGFYIVGDYVVVELQSAGTNYWQWVKFELGAVATSYDPPVIANEIAKCQRYYEVLNNLQIILRDASVGNTYSVPMSYSTRKRISSPTMTCTKNIDTGVGAVTVTDHQSENGFNITYTPSSTTVHFTINVTSDAEIYTAG